jgi:hypothetical protein
LILSSATKINQLWHQRDGTKNAYHRKYPIQQLNGTYIWLIEFIDVNNVKRKAQGTVTLL